MITPRFSLTQDENFLIINIRAPYCNLGELETYIEKNDFRFVCTPYYLRLNLPGNILDNELSSGQFLSETGQFIFKYSKETKGEQFDGLDFITSLLTPKTQKTVSDIEVLTDNDSADNEWHIEQTVPQENQTSLINIHKYGFANKKFNILKETIDEFCSVFDLKNPDDLSLTERRHLRIDTESMQFDSEHFLADYFDDSSIKEILIVNHPWKQLNKDNISFNENEQDILKDLPNREYLLNKDELNSVLYSLIDILFAYCYDKRVTDFEGNCESGWTITKLSSTLSWFDSFENERETIVSSFRRGLIYPLHRNFDLLLTILADLKLLFNLGPVFIIKSLLDIYQIFQTSSDPRYILNDLYIKDYIIFMQKCPKIILEQTINNLSAIIVDKNEVNLNLEQIVGNAIRSHLTGSNILEKMSKLNISHQSDSSDSDSESETSDDSTSSDDS